MENVELTGSEALRARYIKCIEGEMEGFLETATLAEVLFLKELLELAESSRDPERKGCAIADECRYMLGLEDSSTSRQRLHLN